VRLVKGERYFVKALHQLKVALRPDSDTTKK